MPDITSSSANQPTQIDPQTQYGVGPVPFHRHIGPDSPNISYNDLLDLPTLGSTLYLFGNGSDGTVTVSTGTTLTRDMFYSSLSVSSGSTLYPAGYRIFCSGTLSVSGVISVAGGNGGNASGATPGVGGTGIASGTISQPGNGQTGGVGGTSVTIQAGSPGGSLLGAAAPNCILANNGANGGRGGNGGGIAVDPGGAGGTSTGGIVTQTTAPDAFSIVTDLRNAVGMINVNPQSSGGAGGGSGGSNNIPSGAGGSGGGSGAAGGIMWIAAPTVNVNAGGTLTAVGGDGGKGSDGSGTSGQGAGGGGGGGAGGNGGLILLITGSYTNNGSVLVSGGTGGIKGSGGTSPGPGDSGTDGANGAIGNAGSVVYFKVSNVT